MPDFTDTVNFTCQTCIDGFYLDSSNFCEKNLDVILETNCLLLQNNNDCKICKDSHVIIKMHSTQEIVCDSSKFIENCLLYDNKVKGGCEICKKDYLPGAGKTSCSLIADAPAENKILNCETYEYGRCKSCLTGFVRDLLGKTCVDVTTLDSTKTDIKTGKLFTFCFL